MAGGKLADCQHRHTVQDASVACPVATPYLPRHVLWDYRGFLCGNAQTKCLDRDRQNTSWLKTSRRWSSEHFVMFGTFGGYWLTWFPSFWSWLSSPLLAYSDREPKCNQWFDNQVIRWYHLIISDVNPVKLTEKVYHLPGRFGISPSPHCFSFFCFALFEPLLFTRVQVERPQWWGYLVTVGPQPTRGLRPEWCVSRSYV
jgi:hypothetical protein